MEITNKTAEALNSYFKVLSNKGYKKYDEVFKLLILSFLEELINGPYSFLIKEEDYRIIMTYASNINTFC